MSGPVRNPAVLLPAISGILPCTCILDHGVGRIQRKEKLFDMPEEKCEDLLILETYPSGESPHDGLSGIFSKIKHIGDVVRDTKDVRDAKVLVCGIAPLYNDKLSSLNTNILFTTFESDQLPRRWVQAINRYDHCIVPHEKIRDIFEMSGVAIPMAVIHQGYRRFERNWRKPKENEAFVVGFLGIPVARKNLLKLYIACKQLQQTAIPELELHIHISSFYDWLDPAPFQDLKTDSMVRWTSGRYTESQVSEWYQRLSCYVFPSSGEGWSYTPRESMYLGVPTIISSIPVHQELAESGYCKVINAQEREPANFDGEYSGSWTRVDVCEISEAILDVYSRYDHFEEKARLGAVWIQDKWQDQQVAHKLSDFISSI